MTLARKIDLCLISKIIMRSWGIPMLNYLTTWFYLHPRWSSSSWWRSSSWDSVTLKDHAILFFERGCMNVSMGLASLDAVACWKLIWEQYKEYPDSSFPYGSGILIWPEFGWWNFKFIIISICVWSFRMKQLWFRVCFDVIVVPEFRLIRRTSLSMWCGRVTAGG